jgi:hypothetical protein
VTLDKANKRLYNLIIKTLVVNIMNNNDENLITIIEAAGFCAMIGFGALFFLVVLGSMV